MDMRMAMERPVMRMRVRMDQKSLPLRVAGRSESYRESPHKKRDTGNAQYYQRHCDRELHCQPRAGRDSHLEDYDHTANRQYSSSVAQAPNEADASGSGEAPLSA